MKYRYAFDLNRKKVDVCDLTKEQYLREKQKYICIGCEQDISPALGNKKEKHFRHKKIVNCSLETYLHRLAKETFYLTYLDCLNNQEPFYIELFYQECCRKLINLNKKECLSANFDKKLYDLTQFYTCIFLEKTDDKFKPDLLLIHKNNADEKIYIEIAVTHKISEKKQQSKYKIIEIPINSEKDIEQIKNKLISESNAKFIHFKARKKEDNSNCSCEKQSYYYFVIHNSGKYYLGCDYPSKIIKIQNQKNILYFSAQKADNFDEHFKTKDILIRFLYEAYTDGFPIENCVLYTQKFIFDAYFNHFFIESCLICKYVDNSSIKKPCNIVCCQHELIKQMVVPNSARHCNYLEINIDNYTFSIQDIVELFHKKESKT